MVADGLVATSSTAKQKIMDGLVPYRHDVHIDDPTFYNDANGKFRLMLCAHAAVVNSTAMTLDDLNILFVKPTRVMRHHVFIYINILFNAVSCHYLLTV